jgi:hypothetical protein
LLSPPEVADYDPEYVHADRDRVTLIEAEPFMHGRPNQGAFTESGYSEGQLDALREATYEQLGYVDVIANVHDLQLPFKYAGTGWRNEFQRRTEVADAVLSDGMWFKAGVDMEGMRDYGHEFVQESVVDAALDDAVQTGSPIDFSRFEESYADEPEWVHVAGSGWDKKQVGTVMEIAELLHEKYGIRTVMTSMSQIPAEYAELPWVEAHSKASRTEFEDALRKGDLCISATEYETLARTWFEQAGSGQVLIARNQPWIYDAILRDYELAGPLEELPDLAIWAVEHWDEAVAEARRMLEYAKDIRDPERSGQRTYDDMAKRVESKVEAYEPNENDEIVGKALEAVGKSFGLDDLNRATTEFTDHGDPLLDGKYALSEMLFALRRRGYRDTGNPGTPVFEKRE